MAELDSIHVCKACNFSGTGKYCSQCGQAYKIQRIKVSSLLHDIFHFFTHFEKGFGYTLKQLILSPGYMQRNYIEGDRARHQKPFSMFFLCATIAGIGRYWVYWVILRYYHAGNISEAKLFHEYWVLLQVALIPFTVLVTYLVFLKSKYNYAEIGVLTLYNVSFFFLVVTVISLLKFFWPTLETAYIELPLLSIYNTITLLNFFDNESRWIVLIKSIFLIAILFFFTQKLEDIAKDLLT